MTGNLPRITLHEVVVVRPYNAVCDFEVKSTPPQSPTPPLLTITCCSTHHFISPFQELQEYHYTMNVSDLWQARELQRSVHGATAQLMVMMMMIVLSCLLAAQRIRVYYTAVVSSCTVVHGRFYSMKTKGIPS